MLKSYPKLLISTVISNRIVFWELTSYSGSGTARYKCIDSDFPASWVDVKGRYPKMWREELIKQGFRELTDTEKLIYEK